MDCTREVGEPCHDRVEASVARVVDGDTFDVETPVVLGEAGEIERFRLLCLDTPETGECHHGEATEALRERIEGRTVTLAFAEECIGEYGRGLVYVVVDGSVVNVDMARAGHGRLIHEPYDDHACCVDVDAGEQVAHADQLGGWGTCTGSPWSL